jgi:hypothetical protein
VSWAKTALEVESGPRTKSQNDVIREGRHACLPPSRNGASGVVLPAGRCARAVVWPRLGGGWPLSAPVKPVPCLFCDEPATASHNGDSSYRLAASFPLPPPGLALTLAWCMIRRHIHRTGALSLSAVSKAEFVEVCKSGPKNGVGATEELAQKVGMARDGMCAASGISCDAYAHDFNTGHQHEPRAQVADAKYCNVAHRGRRMVRCVYMCLQN